MAYTGVYERTIFYNPVNKYSVISVKTSDRSIPERLAARTGIGTI